MSLPDALEVRSPVLDPWAHRTTHEYPVPMITKLFREDAKLETVMDVGLQSYRARSSDSPLHVMSLGCSLGAEADSILAYIGQQAPELTPITVTGVDVNPLAVEAARKGSYVTPAWVLSSTQKALEGCGFTFGNKDHPRSWGRYIDSLQLRFNHNVEFMQADMREEPCVPEHTIDILLCNNVLYHLTPDDASSLVQNAVSCLAPGGIMSWEYCTARLLSMEDEVTNYRDWRIEMGERLAATGVLPIAFSTSGTPYIFRAST